MKKTISIILTIVLSASILASCGGSAQPTSSPAADSSVAATSESTPAQAAVELVAFAEKPVILTSVGQSQELQMLKTVLDKQSFEYSIDNLLDADGLGDNKTIALVVGGSSKGLGAAGIDAETEIARAEKLIQAAKDKGMSIIVLHLGKDARRGDLSDRFITPSLSAADYMIVVEGGNNDGIFTKAANTKGIPLAEIPSISGVGEAFAKAFK